MSLRNAFENLSTEDKQDAIYNLVSELNNKIMLNNADRIKVAALPGIYDLITGDITAVGGTISISTDSISNLVMHCKPEPTVAGHNSTFEGSLNSTNGSDGTWFTLQAIRSNANTIETATGALSAAPVYAWEISVNGLRWFRVRATAHTSGVMRWMLYPGAYATEPIPGAQTHSVSGTISANIGTVAPVLYVDTTTWLSASAVYTGTSRDAGSTPAYHGFSARAYADQPGTLYIQDSTDNLTWRNVMSIPITAGETQTLVIDCMARYNRVYYVNGDTGQGAFRITSSYRRIK